MKATDHRDNVVHGKTPNSPDAGCRRNGKPFGVVGNDPPVKPKAPENIIVREGTNAPTIVSPPLYTECPSCHSKDIHAFMDMTGWDLLLFVATCFIVDVSHRHYRCRDCNCVWRD